MTPAVSDSPRRSGLTAVLALFATFAVGAMTNCGMRHLDPSDPILNRDWLDRRTGQIAQQVPGVPLRITGPDGVFDTRDDQIVRWALGDVDLVVRAGPSPSPGGTLPPVGVAPTTTPARTGFGSEVDFTVYAVDGWRANPFDGSVAAPSLEGNPIVVLAFADFDGDGWVGPTVKDQNEEDTEIEESELAPVAMQVVTMSGGVAQGRLRILAAGPPQEPLTVVISALAYTGKTDPGTGEDDTGVLGGNVPTGPLVSTAVPFPPPTEVYDVVQGRRPEPPTAHRPLALEIRPEYPTFPLGVDWSIVYSIPTDGSRPSIDVASVTSSTASRLGLVRPAALPSHETSTMRAIRPGLSGTQQLVAMEIVDTLHVPDDGADDTVSVRVAPLDVLGNVAALPTGADVAVSTTGPVRIVSPDLDGDPFYETLFVPDASGVELVLDDSGGVFDDPLEAALVIEGDIGASIIAIVLPDPDVDDSGSVDQADLLAVESARGMERGESGFDSALDVNGSGDVDDEDALLVEEAIGASLIAP